MEKQTICKFCKQPQPNFDELKFHCQVAHEYQYKLVANWLGDTTEPKLRVLEELIKEDELRHDE